MIEPAMVALITGNSTLQGIIAGLQPQAAPENAQPPFVVYHLRNRHQDMTLSGPSGLRNVVMYVCAVAKDYATPANYVDSVFEQLGGKSYLATNSAPAIQGIFVNDAPDDYVPPVDAESFGWHLATAELNIWYNT
jgi:hypothetical protein